MIDPNGVTPINTQAFPIEDFSGGKTDFYLGGPMNKAEEVDNLLIVKQGNVGKLYTRPGSEILDEDYYQIPAGAQRIGTLIYHVEHAYLFYQSARKIYYVSSGWNTLQGPSGNDLFPSGIDTTHVVSYSFWRRHILITSSALVGKVSKLYVSSTWKLRTAGLPALASSPTITAGTAGATFSYLYRFIHEYLYTTAGSVSFVDQGPTTEVVYTANAAINAGAPNTAAITAIPVLANGTTDNYDTASVYMRVAIYRTTDGGTNFFRVGYVQNGTTTYNDTMTDATLVNQEPLYTEGGYPENDPPPLCKVLHVVDDRCFYGHCKLSTGETIAERVYQSVPGDVDSVPEDNYTDLSDSVVSISSHKSVPLVFCERTLHRLEGAYDELGGGSLFPVVISDVHGCVSQQSPVQTPLGVFWAGLDGFYWTDGYQSMRVSAGLRETYQSIISTATRKSRIQGKYDSRENRVYWTAQLASTATEVDTLIVLDLNWGISDDMPITTMSGGANFRPTAIEFMNGELIRGDSRGYTFRHASTLYTDPRIDTGTAPTNWSEATIIYNWISCATNFGTPAVRHWVPSCSVVCQDETNLSLQITSINDDGLRTADLKPIRHRGSITWGDPDVYWGDPDVRWGGQGIIDQFRRFPAQSLRCTYKQAQLTNAWVAIVSSDTIGTATVNSGALTVTLDDTSFDWPSNAVDYYIAFSTDSYVQEFQITARTADVLTIATAGGGPPNGSVSWVIRGYPKGEVLYLDSFTFNYATFGQTQRKYRQNETGEVGASDD